MNPLNHQQTTALLLAVSLTGTQLVMSGVAGWQRGGTATERWLWLIAAVAITAAVDIYPALVRERDWTQVFWVAALVMSIINHGQFFTLAERHAGQERVTKTVAVTPVTSQRNSHTVNTELLEAQRKLARMAYLPESTRQPQAEVVSTLKAELERVTGAENESRHATGSIANDPLGARLATVTGWPLDRIMLTLALLLPITMTGLAIAFWRIVLTPQQATASDSSNHTGGTPLPAITTDTATRPEPQAAPATTEEKPTPRKRTKPTAAEAKPEAKPPEGPPTPPTRRKRTSKTDPTPAEIAELIQQGKVRGTVRDIRDYLKCAQETARVLCRQATAQINQQQQLQIAM